MNLVIEITNGSRVRIYPGLPDQNPKAQRNEIQWW
jgi:hypothetical protein